MDYSVPVTQARAEFADLINRAAYGHERIVITRHGRVIAALISADDLAALENAAPPGIVRLGGGPVGGPGSPAGGTDQYGLAARNTTPEPGDPPRLDPGTGR